MLEAPSASPKRGLNGCRGRKALPQGSGDGAGQTGRLSRRIALHPPPTEPPPATASEAISPPLQAPLGSVPGY